MNTPLVAGYSPEDTKRIETHLKKLFKYVDKEKTVVVGGLAIRHHLISKGLEYPDRPFNDLDIIVPDLESISKDAINEFWVQHYHLYDGVHAQIQRDRFYLVLVDPESKTKIDIFDCEPNTPHKTVNISFNNSYVKIVGVEDQLKKTVLDIYRICENVENDPKQLMDANYLFKIADINLAEKYWTENDEKPQETLHTALKMANEKAKEHPELLVEHPYRRDPYLCKDCIMNSTFPVTNMEKIYKLMGYIE